MARLHSLIALLLLAACSYSGQVQHGPSRDFQGFTCTEAENGRAWCAMRRGEENAIWR